MPLHTLVTVAETGSPTYKVTGDFDRMIYFCPDIRYDEKNKDDGSYIDKTEQQLATELKSHLSALSGLAYTWLEKKFISDYWLVITPQVCDSLREVSKPQKRDNYIVTPFYTDDIDLVEKIFQSNKYAAYGTSEKNPDSRRRRGSDAELSVYVACEINDQIDDLKNIEQQTLDSNDRKKKLGAALLGISLDLGSVAAEQIGLPTRTFIQYGTDVFGTRFVEQYFNIRSKKTKGYPLGEGYIKNLMAQTNLSKNAKYSAFPDLFGSSGYQFSSYGLSKEELREKLLAFEENPWVTL
jgi:hypothetical protein